MDSNFPNPAHNRHKQKKMTRQMLVIGLKSWLKPDERAQIKKIKQLDIAPALASSISHEISKRAGQALSVGYVLTMTRLGDDVFGKELFDSSEQSWSW